MTSPGQQVYRLRDVKNSVDDYDLTFRWANDELARQMSFNPKPIRGGQHGLWFEERIGEGRWWILEKFTNYWDTKPIGQIRFDRRVIFLRRLPDDEKLTECFIISIFIDESFRGKGWAKELLRFGLNRIDMEFPYRARKNLHFPLVAYIKSENTASLRLFSRFMHEAKGMSGMPLYHTYVRF